MPVQAKAENDQHADDAKGDSDKHAELPGGALRAHRRSKAPLAKKIPDANAKVKGRGQYAD
jgi:hypothetical protein